MDDFYCKPVQYPLAMRGEVVDDYFGIKVADPYRWLENLDSAETRAWIEQQTALCQLLLKALPAREALERRLTELYNCERYSQTQKHRSGLVTFYRNSGLQNQSVLYIQNGMSGAPRVLIDPNLWSEDGTVALTATALSQDGRWLAYGRQIAGSDWVEYRVRDVETGEDRADRVGRIKFSGVSWTHDHQGFFYSRYPDAQEHEKGDVFGTLAHQKLYYHRLGTDQRDDLLIHERPDQPEWLVGATLSDDGRYLVMILARGSSDNNLVYASDLGDPLKPRLDAPIFPIIDRWDAKYHFVGNDDHTFYFQTSKDAPRYRIVAINLRRPQLPYWREVVPQAADVMRFAAHVGGELVVGYLHEACSRLLRFGTHGTRPGESLGAITLPGIGTVYDLSGRPDDSEIIYSFTSFNQAPTAYCCDLKTSRPEVFREPQVNFQPDDYITEQIFYRSKDGTRAPMFISYRKGLVKNAATPTLLYGYGGFEIALTPYFSVPNLTWMERGGIFALACVRGGGEYGEAWHRAGTQERKQNVFDDFIAAAECLIGTGYTSAAHLAINGGSNGGLLVGAVTHQRPDLFAAAVPEVGVMDMLRYHQFTIGRAWASDYGTADNRAAFEYLSAYSPYHQTKPGTKYPAVLVMTADHDDRVHPAHSFKYAAAMQFAQAADKPVLVRIETRAGHGAGKPLAKIISEDADKLAFLCHFTKVY